jgi:hypothetical protein
MRLSKVALKREMRHASVNEQPRRRKGETTMKKLIGLAMAVLLTASSEFAAGGVSPGNTGQITTRVEYPRAEITSPKDGAVFYGAYTQTLTGYALYADRSAVPGTRLRWLKTVGGTTWVLGSGGSVSHTFKLGEHKLTLQALTESNTVAASASITVTFYESIR